MKLFGRVAATDVVRKHQVADVAARVEEQLAAAEQWTVVEIRRVYRAASVKDPITADRAGPAERPNREELGYHHAGPVRNCVRSEVMASVRVVIMVHKFVCLRTA